MSSSWTLRGGNISSTTADAYAGYSTAISSNGSVVAVGSPNAGPSNKTYAGLLRIYEWSGSAWTQRGADIEGQTEGEQFGWDVALSSDGSIVIASATGFNNSTGCVRIYSWSGSSWILRSTLDGTASGDGFGGTIAYSSSLLAVGSPSANSGGGAVSVYDVNTSTWTTTLRGSVFYGSNFEGMGAVALSSNGTTLAIGSPNYTANTIGGAGKVSVYTWSNGSWTQRGQSFTGTNALDNAGGSIALSSDGNTLVYGAPSPNGTGSAYVYYWDGATWQSRGSFTGSVIYSYFGQSVSLTNDGSIMAIGEPYYAGSSTPGKVHVYKWNSTQWTLQQTINGIENDDLFGTSSAVSSDGSSIVIGAPAYQAGYGAARVYYDTSFVTSGGDPIVPCFFGNAPVLTKSGYRRMDSLRAGDRVMTPEGAEATVERVKVTQCTASPHTNPYVIPRGRFGAERRVLISPNHKVVTSEGMVEARHLGLEQEAREGTLTYYNLELSGQANMVVGGVAVESLAPVRRMVLTMDQFKAVLQQKYGASANSAGVLANIQRTCRFLADGRVEVPVLRR